MRRAVPRVCFLGLVLLFGTLRQATAPAQQAGDGNATFDKMCAACHGKTGTGNGPAAAGLRPKPASFADLKFQSARTDDSLRAFITKGKPPMPGFGKQLSAAQVNSLVAYIRQLGLKSVKP
ncbi:MAG: cytochrome c [Gemmatimonadetes bacterium]|nr:cytochrome c [Gemmatimonadota bacterium]